MPKRFNVRAYGLLERNGKVLVSDEIIRGRRITKFPGGGLEFGEGLGECIVREFSEELGMTVEIIEHFYTTDFFVASAFDPESQVISVYYKVTAAVGSMPLLSDLAKKEGVEQVRWLAVDDISEDDLTLIIDKKVAAMLRAETRKQAC